MPRPAAIDLVRDDILAFFEKQRPRAYRMTDLRAVWSKQRNAWGLPKSNSVWNLTEVLLEAKLREISLRPEHSEYKPIPRYLWGECTALEVASTLREKAYLSHGTAMFLHGLTLQVPRTFYVNREQTPKPEPKGPLVQANINRAFKGKQRVSKYIFVLETQRYVLLSGKNTRDHGVIDMTGPSGEPLRVTGVERTLVDIVVRPAYAGGVVEVLGAYRAAREQLSISKLVATLRALGHLYPYHQAIGFLMERAGYDESKLKRLRALGIKHDFYLTHAMADPEFDESWRIFHPQGF